jgi:hypothetical protein
MGGTPAIRHTTFLLAIATAFWVIVPTPGAFAASAHTSMEVAHVSGQLQAAPLSPPPSSSTPEEEKSEAVGAQSDSGRDVIDWLTIVAAIIGASGTAVAAWAAHKATRSADNAIELAREANRSGARQAATMEREAKVSLLEEAHRSLSTTRDLIRLVRSTLDPASLHFGEPIPHVRETRDSISRAAFYLELLGIDDASRLHNLDEAFFEYFRAPPAPDDVIGEEFVRRFKVPYELPHLLFDAFDADSYPLWDEMVPDRLWNWWLTLAEAFVESVRARCQLSASRILGES